MGAVAGYAQFKLAPQLDEYIEESIFDMLGGTTSQEHLQQKLAEAEDTQRQLQLQVHHLNRRLHELEYKYTKSKEEASLISQALKRQVADGQRVAEHCQALTQECARLENECILYHNDREVFMEVAENADDRAAMADERAAKAEEIAQILLLELESLKRFKAQDRYIKLEMVDAEDVTPFRLQQAKMEANYQSLQEEMVTVSKAVENVEVICANRQLEEHSTVKHTLVTTSNLRYEELLAEIRKMEEACEKMQVMHKDELTVHTMVSSAIAAGICKAIEEERDDALKSLNLQFKAILKPMKAEMGSHRQRVKVAEKKLTALLMEVQALRQEAIVCKSNLDKADDKVQLLDDENKELRSMLRANCAMCLGHSRSPLPTKGVRFTTTLHAWHKCPQAFE